MDIQANSDDQVASLDEFDIELAEGVEDDTVNDETSQKRFTIRSYGADYTVDSLVKRMRVGAFRIPEFQRRFVWSQKHASRFIESLLMGLPVPGIFLYKEAHSNKHLVIDGQQRLRALEAFYSGKFGNRKFSLEGIRDPWNGKTFDELDPDDRLKLDDAIVHATIFTQEEPEDVLDSIFFVFERINSGGIRLSPQEIRNCISDGPFIRLVKTLNHNESWRRVFGPQSKRAKDEELIIRFLAMLEDRATYQRPMASFLNAYSTRKNCASPENLKALGETFIRTIEFVDRALGKQAFRPVRSLNAAVFDAVMVGLATRLQVRGPEPDPQAIRAAYDQLLLTPEFKMWWERATANEEGVKSRMEAAVRAFEGV